MVPHTVKLLSPTVIRDVCSKTGGSWEGVSTALKDGAKGMFATGMSWDSVSRGAHYLPRVTVQKHIIIIISSMQQNWSPIEVWCLPTKTKASRNGPNPPPNLDLLQQQTPGRGSAGKNVKADTCEESWKKTYGGSLWRIEVAVTFISQSFMEISLKCWTAHTFAKSHCTQEKMGPFLSFLCVQSRLKQGGREPPGGRQGSRLQLIAEEWSLHDVKFSLLSFLFFCVSTGLLVYVAMMVGALVWGGLCDKMGRRKCLIYVLSIDLIFSFLSCFAQGYGFFLFFRFCSGFGWDSYHADILHH